MAPAFLPVFEKNQGDSPRSFLAYYCRNLPHWHPEGASLFVTWHLYGSAPATPVGPLWLKNPAVAQCVVDALRFGEHQLKLYELFAFVVMPNHVHVVIGPRAPMLRITKSIKGYTARRANEILGRTGERFWQDESFDHWIRSEHEFRQIVTYIEYNPVTAKLVDEPQQWPWSSATPARMPVPLA